MSERLSQLSFDYLIALYSGDGRRWRKRQLVRFDHVEIDKDQFRFHVDSRRLPRGRGINEIAMSKPDVCIALGLTIQKPVQAHLEPGIGLWYLVDREHSVGNIPTFVKYIDAYNAAQAANKLRSVLSIPIGLCAGRQPMVIDLCRETSAHMLVGGVPGSGKSSLLHVIICHLLSQPAQEVRLALFDFKGNEFGIYATASSHLLLPVCTEPDEFNDHMAHIADEVTRRYKMIGNASNIDDYNAHASEKLPRWVVVIDEVARVMINPRISQSMRRDIVSNLGVIATQGRAAGIHCILCTQRPDYRVITGYIQACFPARVAFACASTTESKVIIGNGHAAYRESVPVGRGLMVYSRFEIPFQAAWIAQSQRQAIASSVAGGGHVAMPRPARRWRHDVTIEEVARFSIANLNGRMPINTLYAEFKNRGVTLVDLREMIAIGKDSPITIDGKQYIVRIDSKRRGHYLAEIIVNV